MRKVFFTLALGLGAFTGCSQHQMQAPELSQPTLSQEGVAPHVWEEPMVDVVDVPPGLDPEGHYYRPAHRSIVEIRQGRWQHYKDKEAAK